MHEITIQGLNGSSSWAGQLLPSNPTFRSTWSLPWSDERSGSDLPNYKKIIKGGGNATTDFSGTRGTILVNSEPSVHATVYNPSTKTTYSLFGKGWPSGSTPVFAKGSSSSATADSVALGQYIENARNIQHAFKGMQFVGELGETIALLRRPTAEIFNLLQAILGGYRKAASLKSLAQIESAIAKVWLQYAFAWRPLLADARDAVEAYNRVLGKSQSLRCRGYGEDTILLSSFSDKACSYTSNLQCITNHLTTRKVSVSYFGSVAGGFEGGASAPMSTFGFSADEFLPTVWELIPYSFVADYFTNIGEMISAATFVNAGLAWTSRTVRQETINTLSASYAPTTNIGPPFIQTGGGGGTWSTSWTTVQRTREVLPGVPGFRFKCPGTGSTKWYNLAALTSSFSGITKLLSKLL